MLHVEGLVRQQGKKRLLENVTFTLAKGRTLAILGPSGSGKTTLLRLIMGLDRTDGGSISWGETLIASHSSPFLCPEKRPFGLVMQDAVLFPHLSVLQNVEFGIHHLKPRTRMRIACEMLRLVQAPRLARRRVETLSGGERQRVALARSLAPRPQLVLLDEPFANVDRLVRHELVETLKAVFRQLETTTILVTHDARDALELADEVLVLRDGRVAQWGGMNEVLAHPQDGWVRSFLEAGLGHDHPALPMAS